MITNNEVRPLQKYRCFSKSPIANFKEKVQDFIDFLTFISIYIFNLQELLQPFYVLLHDTVDFKWTPDLEKSFLDLKSKIKQGD